MKNKDWIKAVARDTKNNSAEYKKREAKETIKALGWIGAIGFALGRVVRHCELGGFWRGANATSCDVHDAADKHLKTKEQETK